MRLRGWECSLVFVVCFLCSHTSSSSSHRGLLAPVDVTTEVIGDKVKVHWKDNNQPGLVSGAYAAVSEVNDSRLSSTAFIHAEDPRTKSITLSGLIPQMTYSIRVVLYSKDGYSSSSTPVTVAMGSYLRKAVGSSQHSQVVIEVNRVTQNSAMLSWKYPVTHSIHGLQFKLNCNGRQTFLMNGKTIYEYYPAKSYITDALSKYTQKQLIEDLVPNVNYTCELATYSAASQKAFPIATAHFTTLVGRPRAPEEPRVNSSENGITISLTATTNQFGPISHYTLIAVPVHKDKEQPITTRFTPLIPYNKVVGKAIPSHSASKSDKSVTFIIGTYPGDALPSEVVLGNTDEVLSAFKPNQYYVVVLAAFAKSKENPASLFSLSAPSFPPFVISNSLYLRVIQHAEEEAVEEASQMVLLTVGTVAICGIVVIIVALGAAYALKKKGYKIPLKWSGGSVDGKDYVGLTVDKLLVYGEKTYVPMKPLTSMHTPQSARVASEAGIEFDNPHFDVAVCRTKGLLENLQVSVDYAEASPAAENPPQSPTEYSQPPTTFKIRNEDIPLVRLNKKLGSSSPFTYSTPGELEKLQTGTFSLPRSTGPIKTPRRRVTAVTKSPVNKGIPTPAPCKPATVNNEEPPVIDTSNEKLPTTTDVEESGTIPTIDDEAITVAATDEQLPTAANIDPEEPLTTDKSDQPPTTGTPDKELLTVNDKPLLTVNIDQESLIIPSNNGETQKTIMSNSGNKNNKEPLASTSIEEEPTTTLTGNTCEAPLAVVTVDKEPLITTNTNDDEVTTTTNMDPLTSTSVDEEAAIPVNTNTDEIPPTTTHNEEHAMERI